MWFVKARRWIVDQRSLLEWNCRSPFLPLLSILASFTSAYAMTSNPPSKANYALLSPYVYVTDRRVATAGHDSGFWSTLSLCSAEREYVGRGSSEEGYAGERVQGLYTIGTRQVLTLEYEMTRGGWRNTCWPVVLHRASVLQSFQSKASSFSSLLCSS